MTKILLVEDDNNLREIYEARLQAEGYTIVSAHDGEEALVVAKAEKPDLIISDVMMPKISGFEMLDILRNTDSLKNVKVMMLTALGQSEDQQRADKLGADRYLVKSQVTLEDIVNEANELVKSSGAPPPSASTLPSTISSASASQPTTPVTTTDVSSTTTTLSASMPVTEPTATTTVPVSTQLSEDKNMAESSNSEQGDVKTQIDSFVNNDVSPATNSTPATPVTPGSEPSTIITPVAPATSMSDQPDPDAASGEAKAEAPEAYSPQPTGKKVIEPLADESSKPPDINTLLEREAAREIVSTPGGSSTATPEPTPSVEHQSPIIMPVEAPAPASEGVDQNNIAL